jgi:hypothetical protein
MAKRWSCGSYFIQIIPVTATTPVTAHFAKEEKKLNYCSAKKTKTNLKILTKFRSNDYFIILKLTKQQINQSI